MLNRAEKRDMLPVARESLRSEFVKAFMEHPLLPVRTPDWGKQQSASVADVVYDDFAGTNGDASLAEVLRIVGEAAKIGNPRAIAWREEMAQRHADRHAQADVEGDDE